MLACRRQTIPERGMAKSHEPSKCWWAPTISRETAEDRVVKFCTQVGDVKFQHMDDNWAWLGSSDTF